MPSPKKKSKWRPTGATYLLMAFLKLQMARAGLWDAVKLTRDDIKAALIIPSVLKEQAKHPLGGVPPFEEPRVAWTAMTTGTAVYPLRLSDDKWLLTSDSLPEGFLGHYDQGDT